MRRTSEAVRVRLRWAIADETGRRASDVACCMVPITVRLRLHAMLCVWGGHAGGCDHVNPLRVSVACRAAGRCWETAHCRPRHVERGFVRRCRIVVIRVCQQHALCNRRAGWDIPGIVWIAGSNAAAREDRVIGPVNSGYLSDSGICPCSGRVWLRCGGLTGKKNH